MLHIQSGGAEKEICLPWLQENQDEGQDTHHQASRSITGETWKQGGENTGDEQTMMNFAIFFLLRI